MVAKTMGSPPAQSPSSAASSPTVMPYSPPPPDAKSSGAEDKSLAAIFSGSSFSGYPPASSNAMDGCAPALQLEGMSSGGGAYPTVPQSVSFNASGSLSITAGLTGNSSLSYSGGPVSTSPRIGSITAKAGIPSSITTIHPPRSLSPRSTTKAPVTSGIAHYPMPNAVRFTGCSANRPHSFAVTSLSAQDDVIAKLSALLEPLLTNVESNLMGHMNMCFQEQSMALEHFIRVQEQQRQVMSKTLYEALDKMTSMPGRRASRKSSGDASPGKLPTNPLVPPSARPATNSQTDAAANMLEVPLLGHDNDMSRQTSAGTNTGGHLAPHMKKICQQGAVSRLSALFPEVDDLKESVTKSLSVAQVDVETYYHDTGICKDIASNSYFKSFILGVIVLSTVWIAIDTDYNKSSFILKSDLVFQVADNLFCSIFSFEIFIRWMSFKEKRRAFQDAWFVFDACLVALMIWETWIMVILYLTMGIKFGAGAARSSQVLRMFRLIRLVRVARATRLLKYSPELLTLAWGVLAGLRSVFAVLVLLTLLIYVFAVLFTMALNESAVGVGVFETVPQSMNHLLLQVLCGPDADFMTSLLSAGASYYFLFLLFLLGSNLTLMNMLIGILVDVVGETSQAARDEVFKKEVEKQISRLALEIDLDKNGGISRDEFDIILSDSQMTLTFDSLGVDIVGLANFARFIYEQCDEIPYMDFGRLVGEYRGNRTCTVKDVMEMRRYVTMELVGLEHRLYGEMRSMEKNMEAIEQNMESIEKSEENIEAMEENMPETVRMELSR